MNPLRDRAASGVERFFQYSLLGLVATGFLALAASRYLDRITLILTAAVLILRGIAIARAVEVRLPANLVSAAALAYMVFYPIDLYYVSRDFLTATIHGICFLGGVKILTARSDRDYLYTGAIAFIELAGAALFSFRSSFFAFLALYILFAIAAFTSAEIRAGLRRGDRIVCPADTRVNWRLSAMALAALAAILVITSGLFMLVPRTARAAAMLFPHVPRLTGYSGVVDLGQFGEIAKDNRPVMHVLSYARELPPNLKWRGGALSHFDGRRWLEVSGPKTDVPIVHGTAEAADRLQRSRRDGQRLLYRVEVDNSDTGTLFIAGIPEYINVAAPRLVETRDRAFRVLPVTGEDLQYEVSAHSGPPLPEPLYPSERGVYLRLPPIDTRIWPLARAWAGEGEPIARALRIQRRLRRDFTYTLENSAVPVRDPLARFLFQTKRGYCEYFASAMAVMLRTIGIPSRVATGYQSGYYNDVSGMYVLRASDAHVWVEAWFDDRGWVTFDPTPSAANTRSGGIFARLNMYLDAVDSMWGQWVVAYDLWHQVALVKGFAARLRAWNRGWVEAGLPAGGVRVTEWRALRRTGTWLLGFATGVSLLWFGVPRVLRALRHRVASKRILGGGASVSDATLLYRRMLDRLERRGVARPAWFTPGEFARHAPPEEREGLIRFTAVYNAVRFGGDTEKAAELVHMLDRPGGR